MKGGFVLRMTAWSIALTLVALPLVGLLNGWFAADRWPVRKLEMQAEFANVSGEQIRAAAAPAIGVGFFAVDLAEVQRAVAQLPWVEKVEARKLWPETIVLRVYEQRPYAHWGPDRLIGRDGKIFKVPGVELIQGLPQLSGPDDRLGDVIRFHADAGKLMTGSGLAVAGVDLSARGSWTVVLDSGARIVLGTEQAAERLKRFVEVYPRVAAGHVGTFEYADLRYSNGFAMKWPTAADAPPAPQPAPAPAAPTGDA
ncbi:cell division protein FtsQ/DivIB [Tahibacter soli]|jgi:cell division protein FtsQ|uniref:Cell division protein FtsQ n=1 Tax=Tahibacter soli TaxID=2983605 RepID=A0A9X4BGC3_9GAMM|nr:cell division protein FtsQ/DivIB [Tahibacter soli]MDC8012585.1 cell division protein FtsQ/DivIB [Tahibacter soli]